MAAPPQASIALNLVERREELPPLAWEDFWVLLTLVPSELLTCPELHHVHCSSKVNHRCLISSLSLERRRKELTSDIEPGHDDHTKYTEAFKPVIGTDYGSESEPGRILSGLTSRNSECREMVMRVEVQRLADLLSGLSKREETY